MNRCETFALGLLVLMLTSSPFLVAGVLYYMVTQDTQEWASYVKEYHCVFDHQEPDTTTTMFLTCGDSCMFPMETPVRGATCFRCDKGPRGISVCR